MKLADIIAVDAVAIATDVNSKKRALEELSHLLARQCPECASRDIFAALISREKLGSTGLGSGVGIPHGRIEGLTRSVGAVLKLPTAIDFESIDRQGVDLLFGLIVPKDAGNEHLHLLAGIAALCQDDTAVAALRACDDPAELHALIADQHVGSSS
ncbi:MAG: PTS sugar transporter subunit IIA [Oceanococcaceae bacterium]